MKKFIIIAVLAFVLCVPAFASDSYFASGELLAVSSSGTRYQFTSDDNVLSYFLRPVSGSYKLFVISDNQNGTGTLTTTYPSSQTVTNTVTCSNTFTAGQTWVSPVNYGFDLSYTYTPAITPVPSNWSDQDISNAFLDYLDSLPSDNPVTSYSVTVPRGNVLYFQVASNSDVNFISQFSENSGLFSSGNVYGPWGDTYQRISVESSLPGPGIEFPRSGSDAIVWDKGEPLNVLGQTKVGVFTKSCTSGIYYAFYNPAYQNISTSDGFGSTSVGSNVTLSGVFSFVRVYSLQQILDISTSNDNYDTYYVGTPDGNGGVTWVDQDNQVNYPPSGGENQEDEPISSVSLIESIKRILRNILSEIESIFTFGFSAIRDLVDLMDEFIATFDDLYEWLPEECYTLLIACVSVAIVIGVFKVFL